MSSNASELYQAGLALSPSVRKASPHPQSRSPHCALSAVDCRRRDAGSAAGHRLALVRGPDEFSPRGLEVAHWAASGA